MLCFQIHMCYAIPGKLVEIKDNIGTVDYFGEKRKVLMDSEAQAGDYVYAQGGVVISKIAEQDALKILDFWKEKFFELKKVDNQLAKIEDLEASDNLLEILQKVNLRKELNNNELLNLLRLKDKNELKLLYETANNLRQKEHDNACCVHGIIEFSNNCRRNCFYCGIRKDNNIKRYRMSAEEIISLAKHAVDNLGFKALVLQSGEDLSYTDEELVKVVKTIRKLGVLIFISIGTRKKELYKKLYDAGARAVLLRFETSNKELFKKVRPETNFEERIELIKYAKKIGYLIATGFIMGIPEETEQDIINNIILTKALKADMYSFGPLIPAKNTPLENQKQIDINSVLKVISLCRFMDVRSKILVTSAVETLHEDAKKQGLLAGANSLMINLTPHCYKELYSIYSGRPDKDITVKKNIKETIKLLYSLGRAPTDIGHT